MTESPIRILLLEDNPGDARLLRKMLASALDKRFDLHIAARLSEGLAFLRENDADAILLDLGLPDSAGLDTFHALQGHSKDAPIVVLTGLNDQEVAVQVLRAGGQDYLIKGQLDVHLLAKSIRYAIERKRLEQSLHRREQESKALIDNAPDIIARFDRSLRVLYVNPAVKNAVGVTPERIIGRRLDEIGLAGEELARATRALRLAFETGGSQKAEARIKGPLGIKTFEARFAPETDPAGRVETVLAVTRDVSHYKALEAEAMRARDAAEEANRTKSEFLANMSHEIRTPMNGVIGMTDLALMSTSEPQVRQYLEMVKQSGMALLEIINDILDMSKIEAGRIELEKSAFSLPEMIEATLAPLRVTAQAKGVSLIHAVDPEAPDRVVGDRGRLRQILTNIVGNAVKYTEHGSIAVSAGLDVETPDTVRATFTVRDTGIGIAHDKLPLIFDSFSQVGSSAHVKYGGTGLGLYITKRLVELMDGRIWVESETGCGSTFYLTVTLGVAKDDRIPEEECSSKTPAPVKRLRVLLVEDNHINRLLATELLKRRGHTVTEAGNGREALEKLRQEPFDLVLMDVRMPVMDGLEATRRIRGGEAGDPDIPIVALTAHALKGDEERFLLTGMNAYLAKPIDMKTLKEALEEVQG